MNWKPTKTTTVQKSLGMAIEEMSMSTQTQPVSFFAPGFGSGWLHVDQVKFMHGYRHGRYVVTEPGPVRRKWFVSRVGPDVISAATKHENTWFEYAKHGPTGVVTQMKPEFAGMGSSTDVQRMDKAGTLLGWLMAIVPKVDDILDSMELSEEDLHAFQLTGFVEEAE